MSEFIESAQNERVKNWSKLLIKKYRDQQRRFIVEGQHLIEEALRVNAVEKLLILHESSHPFVDFEDIIYVSQAVLHKLSSNKSEVSMIAICRQSNPSVVTKHKGIVLDAIQDPGNMGTIIRTAVSFNYDFIVLSKDCVDVYNEKCIRSTQGALFQMHFIQGDLVEELKTLKEEGFHIYATALKAAVKLSEVQAQDKHVLILGNEGQGISSAVLELSDERIVIEMQQFESLNVGVAAGICMYCLTNHNRIG